MIYIMTNRDPILTKSLTKLMHSKEISTTHCRIYEHYIFVLYISLYVSVSENVAHQWSGTFVAVTRAELSIKPL